MHLEIKNKWRRAPVGWRASCVFADEIAKKDLVGKKRKRKAGIKTLGNRTIESMFQRVKEGYFGTRLEMLDPWIQENHPMKFGPDRFDGWRERTSEQMKNGGKDGLEMLSSSASMQMCKNAQSKYLYFCNLLKFQWKTTLWCFRPAKLHLGTKKNKKHIFIN